MVEVIIPFKESFRTAMLTDKKTKTSRNKKYGKSGDTFKKFGAVFEIISVEKHPLKKVAEEWFFEEGCLTAEEFKNIWISLHPLKGYEKDKEVFVHTFKRI